MPTHSKYRVTPKLFTNSDMQSKNETSSTPSHRHPPSHKAIIRTAVKELNQLYASAQHLDPHSVYTTAIGNTQKLIEGVKFRPGSIQVG